MQLATGQISCKLHSGTTITAPVETVLDVDDDDIYGSAEKVGSETPTLANTEGAILPHSPPSNPKNTCAMLDAFLDARAIPYSTFKGRPAKLAMVEYCLKTETRIERPPQLRSKMCTFSTLTCG